MIKSASSSIGAALLLAALLLFPGESESRGLRIGLTGAPGQIWVVASQRLADRLEEETNGELTLTVFPSGQLGRDSEMLQQLEIGILDLHLGALRSLTTRDPTLNAWFTPYLFPDAEMAKKATQTRAAKEMLSRMKRFGMIGMAYTFSGYRHVLMRNTAFRSIDDLKNRKIRISNFPAARTWYQALGAAPTPIPLGETYHALQTGVLDGIDIDLDALINLEFHRIGSYLTLTNHMIYPGVFLVSKVVWNDLGPQHQQILKKLIVEAADWAHTEQINADRESLQTLQNVIDVIQLEHPGVVFANAIEAWGKKYGKDPLVRQFQSEVKQLIGELDQ